MTLFTIGFTRKDARTFFALLKNAGVARLLDVRLNNSSQLAGYTKRDDLAFFCGAILGIEYRHVTDLAPTPQMLDAFKKRRGAWPDYERAFLALMQDRAIETLPRDLFADACLLCSEPEAAQCHRRLAAEYLQQRWTNVDIVHL